MSMPLYWKWMWSTIRRAGLSRMVTACYVGWDGREVTAGEEGRAEQRGNCRRRGQGRAER